MRKRSQILLFCIVFSSAATMAPAATPPLGISSLPFALTECAECLDDRAQVLAGSKAGTLLALWFRPTGGAFRADFLARVFDAQGAALSLRRINETNPNAQINATRQTAGSAASGDFVVLWQHPSQIWSQRLDPLGSPLGEPQRVNQIPGGVDDEAPILQVQADGSYDVVWINFNRSTSRTEIGVRRTSPDDVVSPARRLDEGVWFPVGGTYRSCLVGNGETVVVWEITAVPFVGDQQSPPRGLSMRRLDGAGVPVGAEVPLVPPAFITSNDGLQSSVACLSDRTFIVTFATNQAPARVGFDIVARRFNSSGKPLTAAKLLNASTQGDQVGPVIEEVGKGEFVAAWVSSVNGASTVVARRFKRNLAPRGPEVRLVGPVPDLLRAVQLEKVGTQGRLAAGWWRGIGGGPQGQAWARFLVARP